MNYEKKYKEALERARKLYEQGTITESLSHVFPELKESEDERIRKHLIGVVELYYGNTDEQEKKDCLAWLEKQAKKDEEILILKDKIESLHAAIIAIKETHKIELEKRGEQKPTWSEEEKNILDDIIHDYEMANKSFCGYEARINWLKSLKDRVQPKQEWSEEDEKEVAVLEAYIRSKDWSERHIDRALGWKEYYYR